MSWFWCTAIAIAICWVLFIHVPIWISYCMLGRGDRAMNALGTGEAQALGQRIQKWLINGTLFVICAALLILWALGKLKL